MMRVLVADGDPDLRAYLVLLLQAMGHGASAVGGARALSRRAARRAPDAVLCDADLPDGDGIEAGRSLKRLSPGLTIVMMAGNRFSFLRARHAAVGPVLLKPFGPNELMNVLTRSMLSRLQTTLSRAIQNLKAQNA